MDIQTDHVAWYAAGVSTIVLLWDIYKWIKSGPKLNIKAVANMSHIIFAEIEEKSIFVEVTNTGTAGTTITHLIVYRYKNRLDVLFGRNAISKGAVIDNSFGPSLPYVLDAGGRWTGGISQEDLIKKTGKEGYLVCGVYFTHSEKPITKTLSMNELN